MSLDMRRKAKAATTGAAPEAEVTTAPATEVVAAATAPEAAAPKAAKKKKTTTKIAGSLRTIANGRHYKDGHVPTLDADNFPKARAYFDPAGRAAKSVDLKSIDKEKTLPLKDLIQHMNQELFRSIFGQPLRGTVARDLVLGFADVLTALSEGGIAYRIPNGFSAEPVVRKAREARNPKSKETMQLEARRAIRITPTRAVKMFMASSPVA
jgi:nucleoid DNA-binding protein